LQNADPIKISRTQCFFRDIWQLESWTFLGLTVASIYNKVACRSLKFLTAWKVVESVLGAAKPWKMNEMVAAFQTHVHVWPCNIIHALSAFTARPICCLV